MDLTAFFKISYGLYIVSTEYKGIRNGYVANTVFQVTATPAQFAIASNMNNFTTELIRSSGRFGFSVLSQKASPQLIANFGYKSGKDFNKFSGIDFLSSANGTPIVTESCLAWFDCKVVSQMEVGTHTLFIGEVIESAMINNSQPPLTYEYYREVFKGYSPKNAPTFLEKHEKEQEPTTTNHAQIWQCQLCHYEYEESKGDPISGIEPNTPFLELPDDWVCPICGAGKDMFEKE